MKIASQLYVVALLAGLSACGGGGSGPATPTNTAPIASFSQTCVDLTCTFGSTSSDTIGDSITSSWTFGDNSSPATTSTTTHAYASGGTYNVTLTVTDSHGATGQLMSTVTVTAPAAPAAPHSSFTVACASPLDCTFTDMSTYDPGSIPQSRTWDFGDNVVVSATNPVAHRYTVSAFTTFITKLTVTDAAGKISTSTQSLSVAPPATTLNCVGSVSAGAGCVLTLSQAATVTATIVSSNCGVRGNQFIITSPIVATLFADGCYDPLNAPVSINGGSAFAANTALQFAVISGVTGNSGLAFPPSIRVSGDFANGWILTFDDGFGGPGEPDFNDVVVRIKATP